MTTLTAALFKWPAREQSRTALPPKNDWPLMGDVCSFRAGVPEALIHWRKAEGKTLPLPNEG